MLDLYSSYEKWCPVTSSVDTAFIIWPTSHSLPRSVRIINLLFVSCIVPELQGEPLDIVIDKCKLAAEKVKHVTCNMYKNKIT